MNKPFSPILFVLTLCLTGLSLGCSSDDPELPKDNDDDSLVSRELTVYVYPGITEDDGVTPRMTIVDGHEMCTELYDPLQPDVIVYHYMNSIEQVSVVMSASSHGMTIIENDPFHLLPISRATLITIDGADMVISGGNYSQQNGMFTISTTRRLENVVQSEVTNIPSRSDDMDFARSLVMKNIIKPISRISSLGEHLPNTAVFEGAKLYLNTLNDFVVPVAEGLLYSNNEEEFIQLTGEKIYMNQFHKIKCIKKQLDRSDMAQNIYRAALAAYRDVRSYEDEKYDELKFDFVLTTTDSFSFTSRQAQVSSWEVYRDSKQYKPTIRLVKVEDRTATVCGNFTDYDGRFTVTGYRLYSGGAEVQNVKAKLDGSSPYSFNNLTKGTTYEVTSFVTVMGVTYESPAVEFRIDGDLELSEQSLTFSETGGRENVDVTLPSDSWIWEVASDAKWCKVTRLDDDTFNVETTTSKEKRETFVTVTATSPKGDKQVKTITVTQMVIGDFAFFEGLLRMKQDVKYPSKPEYNSTQEFDIESIVGVMRMGGATNLTFALPLSGILFSNWTLSSTPPSGSMLIDGVKVIRFNCASSATQISIDGATSGPKNTTTEFSVKIDFAALQVKILESQHDSGIVYQGGGSAEYKSHITLSGTLKYTDKYTEKYN